MELTPETLNEMEAFVAQSTFSAAQACIAEAGGDVDDCAVTATLVTHGAARAISGTILAASIASEAPKPDPGIAKEVLSRLLDLVHAGLKYADETGWYERQLEESRREGGADVERKLH